MPVKINPADIWLLAEILWPDIELYRKQADIVESAFTNKATYVHAGNKLGKDFVAGLIATSAFVWCQAKGVTCRIVTTSVAEHHLKVLWGEIGRFLSTASQPLLESQGGPLVVNYQEIRLASEKNAKNPLNYLVGRVSAKGEGLAGHHAEFTMVIGDEASGLDNEVLKHIQGWAHHEVWIGNPNPCENFFRRGCESGDLLDDNGRYYRKVVHVCAEDSPNVQLGLRQRALGIEPTGEVLVDGVLTWPEYCERLATWDEQRKCEGLGGRWYEGAEVKLFPMPWLVHAGRLAINYKSRPRRARAVGVDTGEGEANTVWTAVDELGVIEQLIMLTRDTSVIPNVTMDFLRRHAVEPQNCCFDRGGGGLQAADLLRARGVNVRTVGFGEAVALEPKRGSTPFRAKVEVREEKYAFKNRRAQMYGEASELLNPSGAGYAIPVEYADLHYQLGKMPRSFDGEGRLWLPPKQKRDPNSKEKTIIDLIGRSPDEADSFVLSVHGMLHPQHQSRAGAF